MSEQVIGLVVATHSTRGAARSTARSILAAGASCRVVDVDGTYAPVGTEAITTFVELAHRTGAQTQAKLAAATLEPDELAFYAAILATADALAGGSAAVAVLAAGVCLLGDLGPFVAAADDNVAVLPRVDRSGLGHTGLSQALVTHAVEFGPVKEPRPSTTLFSRSLIAFGADAQIELLQRLAADWRYARGALDAYVTTTGGTIVRDDATLLSPWRAVSAPIERKADGGLIAGGAPVTAIDLSKLDPAKPWILEPSELLEPALLVSDHPVLLDIATKVAEQRLADESATDAPLTTPLGYFDQVLRQEARRANLMRGEIPDLLGVDGEPATVEDVHAWALAPMPAAHPRPVARYLVGARALRRDVQDVFPNVPGNDSAKLGHWAITWGVEAKQFDADLIRRAGEVTLAAQPTPQTTAKRAARPEGVNLVGYLSAELGLGQSGRLVDAALRAADVPTSTFDVSRRLPHRQSAEYRVSEPNVYDTTLLCVNGAETRDVVKQVGHVVAGTRRVGMWYWELEEFPSSHASGFGFVNEVWAATDFIRDAIAAKTSRVPVRTVVPPLPQRDGDAPELPARFGIDPNRPFFLFTFDFMSYAGRKNPIGLVDAYLKAFPEERPDGPQLVIKTINGDKKATEAEQLRVVMASRTDLILIEEYLPNNERHVLVAHCAAYVSLHKAEGLGLTLAEAMAWGKPVIATRYGGVVQFMNDENSFLVGWTPGVIPEDMGPYKKGLAWAEPNLDEAAELMRLVVSDPDRAAAIGERAARDIRELHNVEAAGMHMREALAEGRQAWKEARAAARKAKRAAKAQQEASAAPPAPRPLLRRVASRARRELQDVRKKIDSQG